MDALEKLGWIKTADGKYRVELDGIAELELLNFAIIAKGKGEIENMYYPLSYDDLRAILEVKGADK